MTSTLQENSETNKKKEVWGALSELFLDTDTTLFEKYIVEKLANSAYSIPEMEVMLIQDVTPVCIWNAFWWEWEGFDEDWLADEILIKKKSEFRFVYRLFFPYMRFRVRHSKQWNRIAKNINEVRNAIQDEPH